jgi:hypothetical protein
MPTGEQKQKKRTIHALPKPDNFIRYRQKMSIPPEHIETFIAGRGEPS